MIYQSSRFILGFTEVPRGTPYNGLYVEALPERGTFFRLQVYKHESDQHESFDYFGHCAHINKLVYTFSLFVKVLIL